MIIINKRKYRHLKKNYLSTYTVLYRYLIMRRQIPDHVKFTKSFFHVQKSAYIRY